MHTVNAQAHHIEKVVWKPYERPSQAKNEAMARHVCCFLNTSRRLLPHHESLPPGHARPSSGPSLGGPYATHSSLRLHQTIQAVAEWYFSCTNFED